MLKQFSLLALFAVLASASLAWAETQEEALKKCQQWAQEEQVETQEMEAYLADCVKSLTEDSAKEEK